MPARETRPPLNRTRYALAILGVLVLGVVVSALLNATGAPGWLLYVVVLVVVVASASGPWQRWVRGGHRTR